MNPIAAAVWEFSLMALINPAHTPRQALVSSEGLEQRRV